MRNTIIAAGAFATLLTCGPGAPAMAQIPDVEPIFKTWDTNGDGHLTKGEWLAAGRQEEGFVRVDTDRDGKVSLAELKAAVAKMQGEQDPPSRGGAGAPDKRP
ncbi:EF-hand domain-containing protein [Caulobacter sp. UNC358MFTsu5.1]|uniref:EF-hand domain-containing protein n=1 Tax=Caulobacter sp. UNC358MFTsu5.1 TaxID=1449049 RepID=UPI00068DB4C5|nr:EF-hand domain-containing protein [Caulobacter sp. UNC358MFTsu5.1]